MKSKEFASAMIPAVMAVFIVMIVFCLATQSTNAMGFSGAHAAAGHVSSTAHTSVSSAHVTSKPTSVTSRSFTSVAKPTTANINESMFKPKQPSAVVKQPSVLRTYVDRQRNNDKVVKCNILHFSKHAADREVFGRYC